MAQVKVAYYDERGQLVRAVASEVEGAAPLDVLAALLAADNVSAETPAAERLTGSTPVEAETSGGGGFVIAWHLGTIEACIDELAARPRAGGSHALFHLRAALDHLRAGA